MLHRMLHRMREKLPHADACYTACYTACVRSASVVACMCVKRERAIIVACVCVKRERARTHTHIKRENISSQLYYRFALLVLYCYFTAASNTSGCCNPAATAAQRQ